jgi:protein-L-isoaspartate(D-aspartate) O-methyltransferase
MHYEKLRSDMVEKFVIAPGIRNEKVINAMRKVPRHLFVDPGIRHKAYLGSSLPIGFEQTISHPTTVALMSHLLDVRENDKIMEVGMGSGYQAAVLSELGAKVYSIERIRELASRTRKILEKLGYFSIAVKIGDGRLGWPEFAPFQKIIVTASAGSVPQPLLNQLADKGKMIIPVNDNSKSQLYIIRRTSGDFSVTKENWRSFVPLIEEKGWSVC